MNGDEIGDVAMQRFQRDAGAQRSVDHKGQPLLVAEYLIGAFLHWDPDGVARADQESVDRKCVCGVHQSGQGGDERHGGVPGVRAMVEGLGLRSFDLERDPLRKVGQGGAVEEGAR